MTSNIEYPISNIEYPKRNIETEAPTTTKYAWFDIPRPSMPEMASIQTRLTQGGALDFSNKTVWTLPSFG